MKQHAIPAAIAAAISVAVPFALPQAPVNQIVHSVNASKHAWPDLSDAEKTALAEGVAWLKGAEVAILCDGADCRDLQTDIDDAFEDAGVVSTRDRSVMPLGYGMAVVAEQDDPRAPRLAAALQLASGGRLSVAVAYRGDASKQDRGLLIMIGKKPRG